MKNLGTNQKQESTIKYNKQVISNVIKLMELKKSLLISKKEWVSILKTIINEDENLSYWDLYFSLASTQDPALIKLIPIR